MKKIAFDEDRTYGVEIEVAGRSSGAGGTRSTMQDISDALNRNGIRACVEHYNHNIKSHWKVITDSSCGYEVVSPVLKGRAGLDEIKKVCDALNEIGCKVDKRCGLHVHHCVDDYSVKNFKNLFTMYVKYEEGIDQIVPKSRRGNANDFCKSMIIGSAEQMIEKIQRAKDLFDLETLYINRYRKLNLQSYVKYGTIEFRQHSGITDAEKIINWIMLTQFMVTKSKIGNTKTNLNGKNDLYWFLSMLGARVSATWTEDTKSVATYYKRRAKALASC